MMREFMKLLEGYVSDDSGHPLVVYHGTNQTFDSFSKERGGMSTGPQAGAAHGFFFTNDIEEAREYAEHAGRRVVANIDKFEDESTQLRLTQERLEKVAQRTGRASDWAAYEAAYEAWESYEIDSTREENDGVGLKIIAAHLTMNNPFVANFNSTTNSEHGVIEDVVAKAMAGGHDGVIMRDIWDSPVGGRTSTHYVVFSPEQISTVGVTDL